MKFIKVKDQFEIKPHFATDAVVRVVKSDIAARHLKERVLDQFTEEETLTPGIDYGGMAWMLEPMVLLPVSARVNGVLKKESDFKVPGSQVSHFEEHLKIALQNVRDVNFVKFIKVCGWLQAFCCTPEEADNMLKSIKYLKESQ